MGDPEKTEISSAKGAYFSYYTDIPYYINPVDIPESSSTIDNNSSMLSVSILSQGNTQFRAGDWECTLSNGVVTDNKNTGYYKDSNDSEGNQRINILIPEENKNDPLTVRSDSGVLDVIYGDDSVFERIKTTGTARAVLNHNCAVKVEGTGEEVDIVIGNPEYKDSFKAFQVKSKPNGAVDIALTKEELTVNFDAPCESTVRGIGDFGEPTNTVTANNASYTVSSESQVLSIDGQDTTFRFSDVQDPEKYYYDPVYWAVEKNITKGTSAATFSPMDTCTRGQIVTFLWRAQGSPEPSSTKTPFTDLKSGAYYEKAVAWAVEKGITQGTTATTFGPNEPCTRAQIVTFLWRSQGSPATALSDKFGDVPANAYYAQAVAWAGQKGITQGTSATQFSPSNGCTRGQVVTFLYRSSK